MMNFEEKNIRYPEELNIDINKLNSIIIKDVGYAIALQKILDLYYLICSARINLIRAIDEEQKNIDMESNDTNVLKNWIRTEYLKNSILGYNAVEDYTYQCISFAFDMKGKNIKSKEDFLQKSQDINYKFIKNSLILNKGSVQKELLKIIKNYRFNEYISELRNKYANPYKHRGNIEFDCLPSPYYSSFVRKNKEGKILFDSSWIKPKRENLQEVINLLIRVNELSISYCIDILNFLEIDNIRKNAASKKINITTYY
jgi:hypothetical protein